MTTSQTFQSLESNVFDVSRQLRKVIKLRRTKREVEIRNNLCKLTSYLGVRATSLRYKATVEIWAPVQDANYFQSGDCGTTALQELNSAPYNLAQGNFSHGYTNQINLESSCATALQWHAQPFFRSGPVSASNSWKILVKVLSNGFAWI